jgi:sec-independent protein translocase protein TatC
MGIRFLLGFSTESIRPMITISKYLSFAARMLLAFGIIFQLPIVVLFLSRLNILNPQILAKNRKYAILIIFILAAILTPPDVVTQILLGLPLIILYEISIWLSKLVKREKEVS